MNKKHRRYYAGYHQRSERDGDVRIILATVGVERQDVPDDIVKEAVRKRYGKHLDGIARIPWYGKVYIEVLLFFARIHSFLAGDGWNSWHTMTFPGAVAKVLLDDEGISIDIKEDN